MRARVGTENSFITPKPWVGMAKVKRAKLKIPKFNQTKSKRGKYQHESGGRV